MKVTNARFPDSSSGISNRVLGSGDLLRFDIPLLLSGNRALVTFKADPET